MVNSYSWSQPIYESDMKYNVYSCSPGVLAAGNSSLNCRRASRDRIQRQLS